MNDKIEPNLIRDKLIEIIKPCACCYAPPCDGDCDLCNCAKMGISQIKYIADTILASEVIIVLNADNCEDPDWEFK